MVFLRKDPVRDLLISVIMQIVIGTVLEGYQTLAKIASQQTFKPNEKIQQVAILQWPIMLMHSVTLMTALELLFPGLNMWACCTAEGMRVQELL